MKPLALLERARGLGTRGLRLATALATGRPLPFSMTFILTHRCNFRCDYCDIPDAAAFEMSEAEFCGAIDELYGLGMARASFSGGEALMRADAIPIMRHARARGCTTSLNSNAWFADRHLDELADALDMLVVSLDGPAEVHDLVRRKQGSYERVLRTIDGARRRGLSIATITVLSNKNLHVIEDVVRLADEHGFFAYFQPAYVDCFAHGRGLDPAIGPSVLADIAARVGAARDAGLPVGASRTFLERLAAGPEFGDCTRCNAGRYFGTVMPDGVVVPCHLTSGDHAYPNGRDIGFANAFLSLPRPKAGPGCAISPYQETDLIFSLDARAIAAAVQRLAGRQPRADASA